MKQRIISAVVALAIVIPFIYFGETIYSIGMAVVAMAGFIEMSNLKKSHSDIPKIPICIGLIALIAFTFCRGVIYEFDYKQIILLLFGLLLPIIFYKDNKYKSSDAFYLIGMVLFLSMAFKSFIVVRDSGLPTFFYLVSIPIMTDTFAYFLGIKFGKHKMCPKISPKKSWEGAGAGLTIGTIIPSILYFILFKKFSIGIIVGTCILSAMGQLGDLIFSKIKRENDIKDFSNIMPGHGGILDRLDSTIVIFMTYILIKGLLF